MKRLRLLVTIACLVATVDLITATAPAAVAASAAHKSAAPATEPVLSIKARQLAGISARTSSDVWAVGFRNTSSGNVAYTQHWDGTVWRQVATPGTADATLTAVSAASESDVWAAGSLYSGGDNYSYLLHFDGKSWQVASQPAAKVHGQLVSVATVGADDAYAVGSEYLLNGVYKSIVGHPRLSRPSTGTARSGIGSRCRTRSHARSS
jgi:hypothetical protein